MSKLHYCLTLTAGSKKVYYTHIFRRSSVDKPGYLPPPWRPECWSYCKDDAYTAADKRELKHFATLLNDMLLDNRARSAFFGAVPGRQYEIMLRPSPARSDPIVIPLVDDPGLSAFHFSVELCI